MQRAKHKDVSVWGLSAHYAEAGEGPAVLLLHGLGSSLITWHCNIGPLAEAGFRVIAMDLPGFGDSDKPAHLSYDPQSAAEFVYDFTQELKLERVSLVGSSAGAVVAGLLALEHPKVVNRMAMAGPGGMGRSLSWYLRLMSLPLIGETVYRPGFYGSPGFTQNFTRHLFRHLPEVLEELLPEMQRVRAHPGAASAMLRSIRSSINLLGLRPDAFILERLKDLDKPLMTIWGEQDIIIPISQAAAVREALPNSIVHTVPECGHWPHMEQPELFNQLLIEFLGESPGSPDHPSADAP